MYQIQVKNISKEDSNPFHIRKIDKNAIWRCMIHNSRKIEAPASFHISSSPLELVQHTSCAGHELILFEHEKKISITSRRMFIHVIRTRMNSDHNSSSARCLLIEHFLWQTLSDAIVWQILHSLDFRMIWTNVSMPKKETVYEDTKMGRWWGDRREIHWFALVELIRHILNHKYQHTKILAHKLGPDNLELWHRQCRQSHMQPITSSERTDLEK